MTDLSRFVWTDLAALSLYVLSGLAIGFPAGPLLLYTGYHIKALTLCKPGYASKYHLFTSCTPARQIQTHQPMHCLHMYTQTYFMNFEKYNQKLEKILEKR